MRVQERIRLPQRNAFVHLKRKIDMVLTTNMQKAVSIPAPMALDVSSDELWRLRKGHNRIGKMGMDTMLRQSRLNTAAFSSQQ